MIKNHYAEGRTINWFSSVQINHAVIATVMSLAMSSYLAIKTAIRNRNLVLITTQKFRVITVHIYKFVLGILLCNILSKMLFRVQAVAE